MSEWLHSIVSRFFYILIFFGLLFALLPYFLWNPPLLVSSSLVTLCNGRPVLLHLSPLTFNPLLTVIPAHFASSIACIFIQSLCHPSEFHFTCLCCYSHLLTSWSLTHIHQMMFRLSFSTPSLGIILREFNPHVLVCSFLHLPSLAPSRLFPLSPKTCLRVLHTCELKTNKKKMFSFSWWFSVQKKAGSLLCKACCLLIVKLL